MKRAWMLAVLLAAPVWADEREMVGKIFRRPEFLWKSEEKQPPPPVCRAPHVFEGDGSSGLPDRSGLVRTESGSGGLIAPEETSTPSDQGTPAPSEQGTDPGAPAPSEQGTDPGTPAPPDQGTTSGTGTPSVQGTESGTGTPSEQGTDSGTGTPSVQGTESGSGTLSEQGTDSGTGTPSVQGSDSGTDKPAEQGPASGTSTPSDQATPASETTAPDQLTASSGSNSSALPDHPPPPLDYPVEPGLLESFARWWNRLLGHNAKDGPQHILLLLRDLAALLLLGVFLRHFLPLLRQLRNWFKTDSPPALALEENSPEPEILPEWQQLWRQAAELQRQGRPALAQRMSYLAVLAYLDHGGHIRYRPSGTNREYASTLQAPLRDPFTRITRRFERCRYGGHPPDFEEFQAVCREVLPP